MIRFIPIKEGGEQIFEHLSFLKKSLIFISSMCLNQMKAKVVLTRITWSVVVEAILCQGRETYQVHAMLL